jgi:hypothetical protein
MGYFLDRALFGKDAANAILAGRFVIGIFTFGIGAIGAVVVVCDEIYEEIALELRCQHEYGAGWQAEFERYHGSLSHVHTKIGVASLCMVALATVLGWAAWRMLHKHKHRKHNAA